MSDFPRSHFPNSSTLTLRLHGCKAWRYLRYPACTRHLDSSERLGTSAGQKQRQDIPRWGLTAAHWHLLMGRKSYLRREVPMKEGQRPSKTTKKAHFLGSVSEKTLLWQPIHSESRNGGWAEALTPRASFSLGHRPFPLSLFSRSCSGPLKTVTSIPVL